MRSYELVTIFPTEEELFRLGKESVAAELAKQGAQNVKEEDMGDQTPGVPHPEARERTLHSLHDGIPRRQSRRHGKDFQAEPEHTQVHVRPGRPVIGRGQACLVSALSYW